VPVVRTDTANGELASALNIVEAATQRRSTPTPQLAPFASWLAQTNPSDALAIGISGILRAWNLAPVDYPESDKTDSVTRFAETNGFACDLLTSSIDQLVALNLPALLNVECADKHLWVGLVAAEGDTVSVYADGYKTHRVSRQELDSHYAGTALVFWRDPQPNASVLSKGMKGKDVVKLQHDLKVANLLAGAPTGMFGDETVRVISELQEETGLTVDGLVGRQVRMALCGRLPDPRVPSLSSSDAAPQVASPNPDGEPSQRGVPWLATQEDSGQPEMMMFGVEDSAAVGIPQILSTPLDPPPPNDQTTAERAASS